MLSIHLIYPDLPTVLPVWLPQSLSVWMKPNPDGGLPDGLNTKRSIDHTIMVHGLASHNLLLHSLHR